MSVFLMRSDTGAVTRNVAAVINERPYQIEDFGGGPGKTAAENDAAWSLLRTAVNTASRGDIRFSPGVYQFSSAVTLPSPCRSLLIQGAGRNRTTLQQTSASADVMAVPNDGQISHSISIEDLNLSGAGYTSGTGKGFSVPASHPASFSIDFRRMWIANVPSDALSLGSTCFTVRIEDVDLDNFGGHGIVGGNNTWLLERCYVHNVRTDGKAGYRLEAAQATLIACNGLDSGGVWGDFGRDGDNEAYANIMMIGCNVEAFSTTGVRLRAGTLSLDQCAFISAAGSTTRALWMSPSFGACVISRVTLIQGGDGASWQNDQPIHTRNNRAAFVFAGGGIDDPAAYYEVYDEVAGLSLVPTDRMAGLGYIGGAHYHYAKEFYNLRVLNRLEATAGVHVGGNQIVGARGAALPADATDLATVIALANAIKARMKATGGHGLVAD